LHSAQIRRACTTMEIHAEVDARGLQCPLPILRAKKALAQLAGGQLLKVITTDAGAARDFAAFSRQTGHALLAQHKQGEETTHILQRR